MLFPGPSTLLELERLTGLLTKAKDPAPVLNAILAVDPHFAPVHLFLGTRALSEGRTEEAAGQFWEGLAKQPCSYVFYTALADTADGDSGKTDLARDLAILVLSKISLADVIPNDLKAQFKKMGKALKMDLTDPASFALLADKLAERRDSPVDPRLRPYVLLDSLQRQASEELDEDLLGQIRRSAAEMTPVLQGALHEWAHFPDPIDGDALGLIIALLGEIGPASLLADLFEASSIANPVTFKHGHWAVWRMGQRFPHETNTFFRSRTTAAPASLLCGMAEQLCLMPASDVCALTAMQLLLEFPRVAREEDAIHLLAAAVHALEKQGHKKEAADAVQRYSKLLRKADQREFNKWRKAGFVPRLVDAGISGFDLEDVCLKRVLFDDDDFLDEDDDDDFLDDLDDAEERDVIPPPRLQPAKPPGRNYPCWCGSGQKYKKCHLHPDEASGAQAPVAPVAKTIQGRMFDLVSEAAHKWDKNDAWAKVAIARFFGDLPTDGDYGLGKWMICDFRLTPESETMVERYLRENAQTLPEPERVVLESWREGYYGLFKVMDVEPGKGIELKNLCGSETLFVHDVRSSRTLKKGWCAVVRVEHLNGRWELGGDGLSAPVFFLDQLVSLVEREAGEAGMPPDEWAARNVERLIQRVRELHAGGPAAAPPEIRMATGEPFEFCTAAFVVMDRAAAVKALAACSHFEKQKAEVKGATEFVWLAGKPDSGVRRVLGRIEISRGRDMVLECHSRMRLAEGEKLIERFAGLYVQLLAETHGPPPS